MRILFLHEVNYLEKPVFEMHEFPEHLSNQGHEVFFLHYPEGWAWKRVRSQGFLSKITGRALTREKLILITPPLPGKNILDRLLTALLFPVIFALALRTTKPEVIVNYSVPTSGWQATVIARLAGIPIIFRALDVSHKIRRTKWSSFVALAERYILRKSDWVSANNPAMLEYCRNRGSKFEESDTLLPPLDFDHFAEERPHNEVRRKFHLSGGDRVLLYMGSFFYFSGLLESIDEFSKIKQSSSGADLKLMLVGGGELETELRDKVASYKLEDSIVFTGLVSFKDLPNYLAAADVCINPMYVDLVSNMAIPNKILQYMACGKAVVSTRLLGVELTFGSSSGLQLCDDAAEVMQRAAQLTTSKDLSQLGEQNRSLVKGMFSISGSTLGLESLLESLVQKNA